MNETILNELFAYAVAIRRKLHEYPEVGFDLKRTEAAVTDELRKMGIQSTDRYGTCSVVAQIGTCGHDSHTAIVLAAAKYLKEHENELPCRVRFIFQPSEESAVSGAEMMVANGVTDGVDHIICTH